MNNVKFMKIAESFHHLEHNFFHFFFIFELNFLKRREIDQLHYKPAHSLFKVNVKGLIFDDVRMIEAFHE